MYEKRKSKWSRVADKDSRVSTDRRNKFGGEDGSRGERSQRDVFRVRESTHNRHETSNDRKEPTTSTVMATNVLEGQPEAKVCMELVVVEDGLNLVNEILEQVLNVLKDDGMNLDETIDRLGENTGYDLVDEGPQGVKMDEKETYFSKECKVVSKSQDLYTDECWYQNQSRRNQCLKVRKNQQRKRIQIGHRQAKVWSSDHAQAKLGRYVATEHAQAKFGRYVATEPSLRSNRARTRLGRYRPSSSQARSLRSDRVQAKLGRYAATEFKPSSVATQRPSTHTARSLRSDQAPAKLGRYVATEYEHGSVAK
ncbi:hypothetical protein F2Q68_00043067 [Brassica cretica]|uniref:Uncharacterized protein n=1 Tax=Brassica cretica TaxID=69181 RepID=A0A8S9LJI5_BRACR|nr:hypothetical protein F2Q68_00043067 [Brassica cretica]